MKGNIDSKTEKLFFNYTLKNPIYFKYVHGYFFKNEYIRKVFDVVKNEFLSSDKNSDFSLTFKEIVHLVSLYDEKKEIESDFIKALLNIDLSEYKDETIMKSYEPWIKSNSMIYGLMNSYENIKDVNIVDLNSVNTTLNKIKNDIDNALNIKLKKGNIGLDFDNIDDHDQDLEHNKIPSGFSTFDAITEGGFDRKTLTVFMGAPGTGKSLTLQNIAVNMANEGYNVAYISLELSDKKTLKRVGSMRLEIPIKDYNEASKDKEYMKQKIEEMNFRLSGGLGNHKCGKFFIKEFPSGTATVSDIDAYRQQVLDETGIKLDAIFVDYIQIMNTENGIDRNMLYLKGEHLAVGLRAIGQRHDMAIITATQTDKNKYGANTYSLSDIPESKSIADTADMVWGIVLTPLMKLEKKYQWQHLKLRDCSTDIERIEFKFNSDYLKLYDPQEVFSL